MTGTLSLYVARRFVSAFFSAFVVVFMIVVLVDLVELLRRGSGSDAGFSEVLSLALLHAPSLMLVILPFITLIAAIASFARLARSSELVVTRAAGVSVWRLIAPTLVAAGLLGALAFSVYNPIAASTLQRFETLKTRYFDNETSLLSVSGSGLWLRQGGETGQIVIRAKRAGAEGAQLWDVSVFEFGADDLLRTRTEAGRAVLGDGEWTLYQVRRWTFEGAGDAPPPEVIVEQMSLPTELTQEQIIDSFSSPETISFWKLRGFIKTMEASGFSAARHRMFWQSQLATPLLLAAMVLIGAAFSMRHVRFGGLGLMALGAVATGLGYFVLANVTSAFGASGAIPAPFAAWAPPMAMSLLAIGLLLHLEDG
ncbi:MAG: lipopolysaccharide export system permease protein [Paracoccaceae bacterium]|jgi:lipopolysaccharide export system permease protein